jgi:hypothetical protein
MQFSTKIIQEIEKLQLELFNTEPSKKSVKY